MSRGTFGLSYGSTPFNEESGYPGLSTGHLGMTVNLEHIEARLREVAKQEFGVDANVDVNIKSTTGQ